MTILIVTSTSDLGRSDSDQHSLSGSSVLSTVRGCTSRGTKASNSDSNQSSVAVNNIPSPPFATPPKLQPVEQVTNNPGSDIASMKLLTTALARDAIFGLEELARCSLSGRKNTEMLSLEKTTSNLGQISSAKQDTS